VHASGVEPAEERLVLLVGPVDELERALEFPWDKWTVFLHPEQRTLIEREQSGPARVSGSAGTGKTIVALHRAVHLARAYPEGRVLRHKGQEVVLTNREFELLQFLLDHPHRFYTSSQIMGDAWSDSALFPEEVRNYVSRVRKILARLDIPCDLVNRPGRGYCLTFRNTDERHDRAALLLSEVAPAHQNILGGAARVSIPAPWD